MKMFANVGERGFPMLQPSTCLYSFPLKVKVAPLVTLSRSLLKIGFDAIWGSFCWMKPSIISSRGLSLYRKVTIIKSLIIPKFVCVSLLLPTPKEVIKKLNQLLFKFLWKAVDKVTRLSAINEYENGGLKMIDFETMVKSLQLTWLKRIFRENDGAWKSYIREILKQSGGFLLFHCNYDVKDIPIRSQFYIELLQWWAEFRFEFDRGKNGKI